MADKSPLKGAWSWSRDPFKFCVICGPNYISETANARVVKFCTQVAYIKSVCLDMTTYPRNGRGQDHVKYFFYFGAVGHHHVFGTGEARQFKSGVHSDTDDYLSACVIDYPRRDVFRVT